MSTPMSLNIFTKSGVVRSDPSAFSFMRGHGDRHVPVAGERDVAGQVGEAVAVGVPERLAERVLGASPRLSR